MQSKYYFCLRNIWWILNKCSVQQHAYLCKNGLSSTKWQQNIVFDVWTINKCISGALYELYLILLMFSIQFCWQINVYVCALQSAWLCKFYFRPKTVKIYAWWTLRCLRIFIQTVQSALVKFQWKLCRHFGANKKRISNC